MHFLGFVRDGLMRICFRWTFYSVRILFANIPNIFRGPICCSPIFRICSAVRIFCANIPNIVSAVRISSADIPNMCRGQNMFRRQPEYVLRSESCSPSFQICVTVRFLSTFRICFATRICFANIPNVCFCGPMLFVNILTSVRLYIYIHIYIYIL